MQREKTRDFMPRQRIRSSVQGRTAIIVLSLLFSVAAAMAGLLYSSNYAPLILAGAVLAPALLILFIYKPEWALILAILTAFIPLGLLPFEVQSYANRGTVVLVFAAWLFSTLIMRRKIHIPMASWIFVVFIIWSSVTLIWAENFSQALTILQTYILRWVLFLFLAINLINSQARLNGVMNMLAFIGLMLVIAAVITLVTIGYDPNVRFKILAMNENEIGIVALLALMGVMWWGNQPSERFGLLKKGITLLYILITILIVAMSGSRGSTLSLLVTIFAFLFFKPTRPWAWVTLGFAMLGLMAAPFMFSTLLERFTFSGIKGDTMLGGREGLWQAAWLLVRDHLWLGVGVGNADFAIVPYFSDPSVPSVVMPIQVWGIESGSLHNPVLTILAETGVLGVTLYLGTLVAAVIAFVRAFFRCQTPGLRLYFALVGPVFLGYMLSWIKGGGIQTGHSYFLMLALLLVPACRIAENEREEEAPLDYALATQDEHRKL